MDDERRGGDAPHSSEEVRSYYDAFTEARLGRYLQQGNLRIEKAIARIIPYVAPDARVLEIGCGIGLVAEQIAPVARHGAVWACDISESSVRHARQRVGATNVHFRAVDALTEFETLKAWVASSVDLIVMVDVLEHCPVSRHAELFANLRGISSDEATLILTFPSARYQRHLRETDPGALQIIDEEIELPYLYQLASGSGFALKHFSLEDVWLRNQYVHCVLETSGVVEPLEDPHIRTAMRELALLVPPAEPFIFVDQAEWSAHAVVRRRRALPFLERESQYWGPPPDDVTAIREFERLRLAGPLFLVFASPAFWWLETYAGFREHLRSNFPCILANDRLVVFDLRPAGPPADR